MLWRMLIFPVLGGKDVWVVCGLLHSVGWALGTNPSSHLCSPAEPAVVFAADFLEPKQCLTFSLLVNFLVCWFQESLYMYTSQGILSPQSPEYCLLP